MNKPLQPVAHDLTGRRILVTGGASGIGRATAELMRKLGAAVAILDRDPRTPDVGREIGANAAFVADVRDLASVKDAVAAAAKALGGLDGVVNAAGIAVVAPFAETDPQTWNDVIATNLTGPYHVCYAALPFLQQAERASIVSISSGQGLTPGARTSAYAASKGGLLTLSKSLAAELAPIRVNCVCPGMVDTPMHAAMHVNEKPGDADFGLQKYAMKRIAQPQEIAEAIIFLTSDAASFITGIALAVDGGRTYH